MTFGPLVRASAATALVVGLFPVSTVAQVVAPVPLNDHDRDRTFDLSDAMARRLAARAGDTRTACRDAPAGALAASDPRCSAIAEPHTRLNALRKRGVIDLAAASALASLQITGPYLAVTTRPDGRYHGLRVDGLRVFQSQQEGMRLEGDIANVTFRNFEIRHVATLDRQPNPPTGFNIRSGRGILIEDGHIWGNKMTGLPYSNGDGLKVENGVSDVTIRRVVSQDHSDSAFDLLNARDIRLEDVVGKNAARCIRTEAVNVVVTSVTCIDTGTAIELHGSDIAIDTLVYNPGGRTSKTWLFSAAAGATGRATLTVRRCIASDGGPIHLPSADSIWLSKGPGVTIDLGPTCRPPG